MLFDDVLSDHGINLEPPARELAPVDESHPRMKLVRPNDPQFEGKLILHKDKWPKGMAYRHSAEYTVSYNMSNII